MLKKFLENCKKPQGKLGKFIINAMNKGHAPLSRWALTVFPQLMANDSLMSADCNLPGF